MVYLRRHEIAATRKKNLLLQLVREVSTSKSLYAKQLLIGTVQNFEAELEYTRPEGKCSSPLTQDTHSQHERKMTKLT